MYTCGHLTHPGRLALRPPTYNIQLIKLRLLGTKCPHNNSFLFIWKWSIQKYHFVKWTGTGKRTLAINFSGHAVDFSYLQIDWVFYRNGYISSYDRHKQHVRCRAVVNIALSRSDVNEPEQYLTLWLRHYAHGEETVLHDVCRHCDQQASWLAGGRPSSGSSRHPGDQRLFVTESILDSAIFCIMHNILNSKLSLLGALCTQ